MLENKERKINVLQKTEENMTDLIAAMGRINDKEI
jgi:hypothetical protein